jgi:hypothetical protein
MDKKLLPGKKTSYEITFFPLRTYIIDVILVKKERKSCYARTA